MNTKPVHPALSLILPTYNEAGNISKLIGRIFDVVGNDCEIIVVDDNSPDGTSAAVEKMKRRHAGLRLICRLEKRGLTSAIQEGIDASRGRLIGWMDCDFSMPAEILPKLVDAVNHGADIAVGSRYIGGGADMRHEKLQVICSAVVSYLCRALLNRHFRDYTSGFIVAKRNVFDKIRLRGNYGEYFIDLIFNATHAGFAIEEIPYMIISRERGYSKTTPDIKTFIKYGFKYIATISRLLIIKSSSCLKQK